MLFILWYSFIVIILTPTNIHTLSSVVASEDNSKFANDAEEKDIKHLGETGYISNDELSEQNYSDEDVEETNENSVHEAEVSNDLLDANYAPLTKSSTDIRLAALPQQDETNRDLKQESSTRNHEFELKESTTTDLNRPERNFISHSPSTIEPETTHQSDTDEISEIYPSSESDDTLSTIDNQRKQRIHQEDFQYLSSEVARISQTNEPVNKQLEYDQTETSFTEVDEKTLLNQAGESFTRESANPIGLNSLERSENGGNINEANHLELKAGSTELNSKVRTEVEDGFEFNEETRLYRTGESFPRELVSTIELKSIEQAEAESNIHEGTVWESTRGRLTQEMASNTELNLHKRVEVEDGFKASEDTHENQTVGNFMRKSIHSNESKLAQQLEVEDSLKSIYQNGFSENSDEKSVSGDEINNFHLFSNSPFTTNEGNMTDSVTKIFDHIPDLNSHKESKLALELFQHTNNSADKLSKNIGLFQDAALPKEKANVGGKFIPSNNANNIYLGDDAEESENLQIRNIDSKYTARNTSFTSEIESDNLVGSSKKLDSMHIINYPSESDNLRRNNTESLVLKDVYDEDNSDEVKVNERNRSEFDTCKITGCLGTEISTDYESADFSSEQIPKIQKERIRAVGRVLANAMNSTLLLNGSTHKENQSAYEYLENIEFNLHEVVYLIKTDSNVRAFILNALILYVPVLICDVFLWIVIVKLVRHIRHFLVSNKQPKPGQSFLVHENEAGDVNKLISSNINLNAKPIRSGNYIEDDLYESSSEFSEQKVWYPPS